MLFLSRKALRAIYAGIFLVMVSYLPLAIQGFGVSIWPLNLRK
ncbi:MAG: hypothetical protein WBO73_01605 [Gammaproteobacteria bacterium]